MSLHIFLFHKFIQTDTRYILSSTGSFGKDNKTLEKAFNSDKVSDPITSPLVTVRVHVPLTVSAGKYSESSGSYNLRVLVLI